MGASCQGGVITLLYESPADGWTMHLQDPGPLRVSVTFSRGDTDEQFQAVCRSGVPTRQGGGSDAQSSGSGQGYGHDGGD